MIEITDRCPVDVGVTSVNPSYGLVYLRFQPCIAFHMVARRHYDHSQRHLSLVFRMTFEKSLKPLQTMQDAFAIIQTVYGQQQLVVAEKNTFFLYLAPHFRRGRRMIV